MNHFRIIIGVPNEGLMGGPAGHLPYLVTGLNDSQIVHLHTVLFGSRVNHPSVKQRFLFIVTSIKQLRHLLKTHHIDIVHLNTAFAYLALTRDFLTVLFIRSFKARIFLKYHGSDAPLLNTKNSLYRIMIRHLIKWVDGFGLLSTQERSNFLTAGFPERKLFMVKNIVGKQDYVLDKTFARRFGLTPNFPILLFIARFIETKGLLDVLRATLILHNRHYDFHLICVGDGPQRATALNMVAQNGLSSRVIFTGHIPEAQTKQFYANSTMLVLPTYHEEGFPMAVFQSVGAGLPILTTKIRAAADYLAEPDNCLWVEPRNPQLLADRIVYLLDRPGVMQAMKTNNFKLAETFSAKRVTEEFLYIYAALLKDNPDHPGSTKVVSEPS